MKQVNLTISFDEEKLSALKRYMSKRDLELEREMTDALVKLYEKSAIFLILPEEDTTKNFMAGLMIPNLSRELFSWGDENGGKL